MKKKKTKEFSKKEKVDYVRNQEQTRPHKCHWPGCKEQVPPAMWGCKEHWYKIPRKLRIALWEAFVPGQEENGTPSPEYVKAAKAIQKWIKDQD